MGIQGLLPMFRGSTKDVHVSAYAHKTLAVDGYAWLHRGVSRVNARRGTAFARQTTSAARL